MSIKLTKSDLAVMEDAAKPLLDFLRDYGHPNCAIFITWEHIEFVENIAMVPVPFIEFVNEGSPLSPEPNVHNDSLPPPSQHPEH